MGSHSCFQVFWFDEGPRQTGAGLQTCDTGFGLKINVVVVHFSRGANRENYDSGYTHYLHALLRVV